jgi:hypothetical protein
MEMTPRTMQTQLRMMISTKVRKDNKLVIVRNDYRPNKEVSAQRSGQSGRSRSSSPIDDKVGGVRNDNKI